MEKLKILIVEDEIIVSLDIKNTILKLDYEVTGIVRNYDDAISSVKENIPDMILMDINLKNSKDGIETARAIQNIRYIPLIYLTAFSDDETIIRAIETNPINYIMKPFTRDDLKTAIKFGIYKINKKDQIIIDKEYENLGLGYYYDFKNKMLCYDTLSIKLSKKEKTLLETLINARGNIVTFSDLEYIIWTSEKVSKSSLRTLIYRLRTKLEHKIIETVPSFGCRLLHQRG